jgi:hypothetical protein
MIVILVWAMARGCVTAARPSASAAGASEIRQPPVKCRMLTPRAMPSWLTRMKSSFGPWNQVAIM